jgi:hypothetical protein
VQLINSDRRGQAQNVANSVRQRHEAIQKIEADMIQLAQMYQDLESAVVQQEPAVARIEQQGETVNDEVAKAVSGYPSSTCQNLTQSAEHRAGWCSGQSSRSTQEEVVVRAYCSYVSCRKSPWELSANIFQSLLSLSLQSVWVSVSVSQTTRSRFRMKGLFNIEMLSSCSTKGNHVRLWCYEKPWRQDIVHFGRSEQ